MNAYSQLLSLQPQAQRADAVRSSIAPLPIIAAAAVAILVQALWIPIDADVSWLITVCDRVLAGDRLYVDILEVNPPASVWMYLPLVWAAGIVGAKPEALIVAAFVAAALASAVATARVASRLGDGPAASWIGSAVAATTLVLPMGLFAQREHAALLLAFPALAVLAALAEDKAVGRAALCASGIAAGLAIVIKPYFLLPVGIPAIWAAWKRGSLAPLLPAIGAAAAVVVAYALAILYFAQAYLEWLPTLAPVYGRMHDLPWKIFVGPSLFPMLCLALVLMLRPPRIPAIAIAWALGSAGFMLAAFAQAKNYPNHWLPQSGLAFASAFAILGSPGIERARRAAVGAALAFVMACAMYHWAIRPDPAVAAAIRQVAPPAPRVIALSTELTSGHPVTRNVGGRWIGSRASLFTASGARFVGLDKPATRAAYREDIQSFATDVDRGSPDVILVDRPTKAWLMREPPVLRVMRGYRYAAITDTTEIWVRAARKTQ